MTRRYELEAAYYKGLHEMNGMDPEAARDLGFVTDPDEFEAVVESTKHITPQASAREAAHQRNIVDYHLQTDEQRARRFTNEQLADIDSERLAIRKSLGKTALGE